MKVFQDQLTNTVFKRSWNVWISWWSLTFCLCDPVPEESLVVVVFWEATGIYDPGVNGGESSDHPFSQKSTCSSTQGYSTTTEAGHRKVIVHLQRQNAFNSFLVMYSARDDNLLTKKT